MANRRQKIDPAQLNNEQVLADRQARIDSQRREIPDLGLNLPEQEPSNAFEFLTDEWDRKTFGEAVPTIKRIVYGPDPLFDSCPGLKATIERIGLHDYAAATAHAIMQHGATAVPDPILQTGLNKAISKFGVEKVAEAFRERILKIPCREVEYEVDRDLDVEVVGSKVLDDAVARYGRPGMSYKFLSQRCLDVLGHRGYQIVKDEKGDPVKCGTLFMGEIPQHVASRRRAHYAKLAAEAIDSEVEKFDDEAARLARDSGHRGVGPLVRNELITANASETESFLGQSRPAGFSYEEVPVNG